MLDFKHPQGFTKYANEAQLLIFKYNAKIALNHKSPVSLIDTKNNSKYTEILTSSGKAYFVGPK
jgi:hypothetical protein